MQKYPDSRHRRYRVAPAATNLAETSSGATIKQDTHGRFCLNDLHKASGGAEKDKPANWLRLDSTNDLIAEISKGSEMSSCPPIKINSGRYGGTFVCKELVYAYAMWISPKFHLKVIRAYDTLQTQGVAVAKTTAWLPLLVPTGRRA